MGWLKRLARRAQVIVDKSATERELDEELRHHLELEIEEHLRAGMSPAEARRRALVSFGGVERFKEEVRDVRGARLLDDLVQDLRLTFRALPRQPAFTLAVLLTLGIGIGGNVAMFAVLDATMFRALPYPEPDRLVVGRSLMDGQRLGPVVSAPDFIDYRERIRTLDALGALAPFPQPVTVAGEGTPERARIVWVSHDFFAALGVDPVLGRHFTPDEERLNAPLVLMLSHGYWQRRFGGDPDVVGRTMILNGTPAEIVGVMPPGFHFRVDTDMWTPFHLGEGMAGSRSAHNFLLVGRLASGLALADAQADGRAVASELRATYPENQNESLLLSPLHEYLVSGLVPVLRLLGVAVALLLVVACANVAGLLLARGQARSRELAVRAAIGARYERLSRQLLTENTVLALGACVVGVGMAWWIQRGLVALVSFDVLGGVDGGLSPGSVLFAVGLSVATVLLFGLAPALRVARTDPATGVREGTRAGGTRASVRFRSALVVGQVAVTTVLLGGAGLLLRSFANVRGVELGFDPSSLVTLEIQLPSTERYDADGRIAFYSAFEERVRALPGVASVSMASQLPVRDPGNNVDLTLPDDPEGGLVTHTRTVWPGYFEHMGIPVHRGRGFASSDGEGSVPAIALSRAAAEQLFGEEDPLGREVLAGFDLDRFQVVGVVGDVILGNPTWGTDVAMYFPYHQSPWLRMRAALRVRGAPPDLAERVRSIARDLDPTVLVDGVDTMENIVTRSASSQRRIAFAVSLFAAAALLLASVGIYGVMAYQVSTRVREIGVRIALGASVSEVAGGVVRRGVSLAVVGLALGVVGALFAGRLVQGMLFQVGARDPLTLTGVAVFTVLITFVACSFPARRAASVDPTVALRE